MEETITKENRGKQALKSGVWYTISSISVKAILIITTPLFTRLMTTAEYGASSTFTTWFTVLNVICSLNLWYSVGRAKLDFPGKLEEYVASVMLLALLFCSILGGAAFLLLDQVTVWLEMDKALVIALIIKFIGTDWLNKILPPVVIGPTIMVIGLSLAGTAVNMASEHIVVALITLLTAIIVSTYTKGLLQLLPIFSGIVVGYISAVAFQLVDFSAVNEASLFAMPNFAFLHSKPVFNLEVAAIMVPVAIVTITEHIGDHLVLGSIVGRDLTKNPGLHRTLIGDGVATFFAGFIGGPANTTYGENTGVIGLTKVASV